MRGTKHNGTREILQTRILWRRIVISEIYPTRNFDCQIGWRLNSNRVRKHSVRLNVDRRKIYSILHAKDIVRIAVQSKANEKKKRTIAFIAYFQRSLIDTLRVRRNRNNSSRTHLFLSLSLVSSLKNKKLDLFSRFTHTFAINRGNLTRASASSRRRDAWHLLWIQAARCIREALVFAVSRYVYFDVTCFAEPPTTSTSKDPDIVYELGRTM